MRLSSDRVRERLLSVLTRVTGFPTPALFTLFMLLARHLTIPKATVEPSGHDRRLPAHSPVLLVARGRETPRQQPHGHAYAVYAVYAVYAISSLDTG